MTALQPTKFPSTRSTMRFATALLAAVLAISAAIGPARAVEAPFEGRLMRLAEVLGSLHHLRNLCGETGDTWRKQMEELLVTENPEPERRATPVSG